MVTNTISESYICSKTNAPIEQRLSIDPRMHINKIYENLNSKCLS